MHVLRDQLEEDHYCHDEASPRSALLLDCINNCLHGFVDTHGRLLSILGIFALMV